MINNINVVIQIPVSADGLKYGLSTLHAWIWFMEFSLHLAYRLRIKVYHVRREADKAVMAETKKAIQEQLRDGN